MSDRSPISIRYSDEHLLIASKPGGMLVHRSKMSAEREVLLTRLRDQVGRHLYPIHRLDRATSGLILFGFSSESARLFHDQLRHRSTDKLYLGVCRGECPASFASDRPLTNHQTATRQSAQSEFRTLDSEVFLPSKRKSQPVGDTRYDAISHTSGLNSSVTLPMGRGESTVGFVRSSVFRDSFFMRRNCVFNIRSRT